MKRIYIDLDGVLNTYKGDYKPDYIPPPADGVEHFLETLTKDYLIFLFTTRNIELTKNWLLEYNLQKYITEVTNIKDGATLYIDDRAICFDGDFDKTLNQIKHFKPWYET